MQSMYSISHEGNQSLVDQTAFYTESVKKSFDLYYLLMATFKSIYTYAKKNICLLYTSDAADDTLV